MPRKSSVSVKIDTKEIQSLLRSMGKRGVSSQPLMAILWGKVHQEVMLNFRTQSATANIFKGAPSNVRRKWKKHSAYTLTRRPAGGILRHTGLLMGSMGKIKQIGRQRLVYGTFNSLSAVHQMGATIVPKRAKMLSLPYPGVTGRPIEHRNTYISGGSIYSRNDNKPLFFFKRSVKIPSRPHLNVSRKFIDDAGKITVSFLLREGRLAR